MEEINKAIHSLNKGKSADYHGLTIEHVIYAGKELQELLRILIGTIFELGRIPESLKVGLLTPIFKNKGTKQQATNYRGITVLPVIAKIIEVILKNRTQRHILETQNKRQRGFTAGSSPLNSALPIEEAYRESKDNKIDLQIVLLDAKAAFDTVIHSHMMRKAYLAGIEDKHWTLIKDLHENATSSIKWDGNISIPFDVKQGVRQGGILSADLYKLYINQLLNQYESAGIGYRIGNISTNSTACADDIALVSDCDEHTQILINMAYDYASMEGYQLQPTKSVIINVTPKRTVSVQNQLEFTLGTSKMPKVERSTHLGIIRTESLKNNMIVNVEENIKKARRSAYSLFGSGFHGYNGLDVDTMIHLFKIYVTPVLLYGLELILPTSIYLTQLENFQKKMLKQLLSLPPNVADAAVYILTGILPIEAQIHVRALSLFNNICHQSDDSIEKMLAKRQLTLKSNESSSWFVAIKLLLRKYNMQEAIWYLDNPVKKTVWTGLIKKTVSNYWSKLVTDMIPLYSGLQHLSSENLELGKIHSIFKIKCFSPLDIARLPVKLKLLTGSYILQSRRIKMYKGESDPRCLLCKSEIENEEHFVLKCQKLEAIRQPIIEELSLLLNDLKIDFEEFSNHDKMQLILDITPIAKQRKIPPASVVTTERLTRRLLHQIHVARYREVCEN